MVCVLLITEVLPVQATVMAPLLIFRDLEMISQTFSLMPVSIPSIIQPVVKGLSLSLFANWGQKATEDRHHSVREQ